MKPTSTSKDLQRVRLNGARPAHGAALRRATPGKTSLSQTTPGTATSGKAGTDAWLAPSRISHADELQLACRLAECRRELFALALYTRECALELRRIRAELTGGKLEMGDVVELGSRSAAEALDAFQLWIERVDALRLEAARERREARRAAASSGTRPIAAAPMAAASIDAAASDPARIDATARAANDQAPASSVVERDAPSERDALSPAAALISEFEFRPDIVTRLLGRMPAEAADGVAGRSGTALPPVLERRYRTREREVRRIRNRFLTSNQGLVSYVVQRYLGMGLSHEDLMQEGNIGLLRAVEKFDHRRGGRFGTYAVWWVRQGIRRALANQSRTIRVPVHALGARYSLDQAARRLALQLGREPNHEELSGATGLAAGNVAQLLNLSKEPLSLDAPRGPDTDARLGESIPDTSGKNSMVQALERERSEQLGKLLGSLSQRERDMVRMRFGLDGAAECTLEQIGLSFHITRERVRQIVGSALEKLNRQTRALQLELRGGAE